MLHVVIDSILAKRSYPDMIKNPLNLLGRKTFPMPKEDVVKYIIQSGYVHHEWKDTVELFKALHYDTLLTADEFMSGGQVFYSNNLNEFHRPLEKVWKYDSSKYKGRHVFRVMLTTPVFSADGKLCWVDVCSGDGASCYLLKKNKNNAWKIAEFVGGTIQCGIQLTSEDYYKLTGKKIETDFIDDDQ